MDLIYEVMNEINEAKKKKVIRKGKLKKKTICPKGQKAKGGRCVVMKSKEKTTRKMKAKKASVKRKAKQIRTAKKRKKSMKKRKRFGLK